MLNILFKPGKIIVFGMVVILFTLLFDGTLYRIYDLREEKNKAEEKYQKTILSNENLKKKINIAQHSDSFIGRQARETLDLVMDDELVFLFEENKKGAE